ncbi:MAG: galactose mutarotase [Alistipes sp.]|nr:galactose mutarotase [Candidatus Minthomonas equi]
MTHKICNSKGTTVILNDMGAGIVSVLFRDKNGENSDIVLGYKDTKDYFQDGPCAGKTPGRYANRIEKGLFTLDGKEYRLAVNNGPNHLHGGPLGFANLEWTATPIAENKLEFSLESPDGDEGYPGSLSIKVAYTISEEDVISLEFEASTDAVTIINLTNHTYWNLRGENSGCIFDHTLQINAAGWLPTSDSLIPTGFISPVEGTPMDFRTPKKIGQDIKADFPALKYGKGYDNCWVIDGASGELRQAAILSDEVSGRRLEVWTDQPGIQVYTGNWLSKSPISKSGRPYNDYDGVAMECQNFPDAINKPGFPSPILRPCETYRRKIEYRLSIVK